MNKKGKIKRPFPDVSVVYTTTEQSRLMRHISKRIRRRHYHIRLFIKPPLGYPTSRVFVHLFSPSFLILIP